MKWVAGVAQLVEQRIRNAKVGGSIPLTGTMFFLVIQSITRLTPRKSRHDKIASPLGGVFFFSFFTAIKIRLNSQSDFII